MPLPSDSLKSNFCVAFSCILKYFFKATLLEILEFCFIYHRIEMPLHDTITDIFHF